jgi:hypothetical protein
MGQLGLFDLIRLYESLDEKSDPLVAIAAMVPSAHTAVSRRRLGSLQGGGFRLGRARRASGVKRRGRALSRLRAAFS